MSTCLGIYIEDNLIKYAKVSKDNDIVKIDSFGIKFYDKITETIEQVIKETYSYDIPISINLSNENYNYMHLFSKLSEKDIANVINTEFESICYEKGINKDAFETRYVLVSNIEDKEQIKAIHISASKADLAKKEQQLESYKLRYASPVATSLGNLLEFKDKENVMIVNIEDRTTITTILDKNITDIQIIEEGTHQILSNINVKENSYLKAYEICKNTTIYTQEGRDLQYQENDYLDDIMPTLYNIVGAVRKITNESLNRIDKVYITGTASVINNIDIYFQEYLKDIKCEILKPYFVKNIQEKVNIKDYIEVNTPIALALQGLGEGLKGVNFRKKSFKDSWPDIFTMKVGKTKEKPINTDSRKGIKFDFNLAGELDGLEYGLIRTAIGIFILIVMYSGISVYLNNAMQKKMEDIAKATQEINTQISSINSNTQKVKDKTSRYVAMTERLNNLNQILDERNKRKNAISSLLNRIMFSVPKGVQITSIENTSGIKVVINAQASTYDQLGYLKASIKNYDILRNVVSDSGQKQTQEGIITTTIEGDLPIE